MRFDIWVRWELDTIRQFMKVLLPYIENLAKDAATESNTGLHSDGSLSKHEIFLGTRRIVLNAVLYELNSLIEYSLLALVSRTLSPTKRFTSGAMGEFRSVLVNAVEREYGIQLLTLPGYQLVDELREAVNSLKHRGGLDLAEPDSMGIPVLTHAEVSQQKAESYLEAVQDFLLSLWEIVAPRQPLTGNDS